MKLNTAARAPSLCSGVFLPAFQKNAKRAGSSEKVCPFFGKYPIFALQNNE